MLRDVAPTMTKVSHRMGSVQGGHEGNIPVEAMRYCIVVVWVRFGLRGTDKK